MGADLSTGGLTCDAVASFKGERVIKRIVASFPEDLFFWMAVGRLGLVSH